MRTFKFIVVIFSLLALANCDPGLSGNLKIVNESDQVLKCKFEVEPDSTFIEIPPHTDIVVFELSGLGNKQTGGNCCPCMVGVIVIKSDSSIIKKDPGIKENWTVPNKSKLKKYGKEPIKCEFHVTNADI